MGKRGRARTRRTGERPVVPTSKAPTAAVVGPEVHVTVATLPRGDIKGSLDHDAALVKAALLYADRVTLASPNAIMLAGVGGLTIPDSQPRRDALMAMLSVNPEFDDAGALYEHLKRKGKKISGSERMFLLRMEQVLRTSGDEVAETASTVLEAAGMPELQLAMEAEVLGLHMLELDDAKPDEFSARVTEGMVQVLTGAVSANARTFPLFDDGAGSLVASMIAEGLITDARAGRSKQIGAAGQLIGRLEAFPAADMDVVLDVRSRLSRPLTRFRAALARVSREIESPGWQTPTFAQEAEDLYREHVAPALAELEAALAELGALPTLRRLASDSKAAVSGSALFLSAAAGVGLAHLPDAVFGAAPAAGAVSAVAAEATRRGEIKGEAESNEFYFLYEANRALQGGS